MGSGNVNIVLEYMDEGSLNTVREDYGNDFVALLSWESDSRSGTSVHRMAIGDCIEGYQESEYYSPRPSQIRDFTSRTSSRITFYSTAVVM